MIPPAWPSNMHFTDVYHDAPTNRHYITELEQWNANIAFAQVNLSPLADHKPGNWLFPV